MELVCPAGSLPTLKAAIDNGADAVYIGFQDNTNARHFAGLNFSQPQIEQAIAYARQHGRRVFIAINTYAQPDNWQRWQEAVDRAAQLGVDALIIADMGVLDYASSRWPDLRLHLSVQGSATNPAAIRFYHEQFGIQRVVLPRVLSLKQVEAVIEESPIGIEVFGFGSLCVMVEGRCFLSSYVTGQSPNTCGVCSPAQAVSWHESADGLTTRLGGVMIDRFAPHEQTGYPTLCKGRFTVAGNHYHAFEEPTSLNTLALLPQLQSAGVKAIKIEGRQRSPAYVAQVTRVWREAIDSLQQGSNQYRVQAHWQETLGRVAEGVQTTLGAFHRPWQ